MHELREPFKRWRCDCCQGWIERPEDGWVEWEQEDEDYTRPFRFRVVHHWNASPREQGARCYRSLVGGGSSHLHHLLGPDGLAKLLRFLEHPYRAELWSLAETIRRLHIPHYEQARNHSVAPQTYERNGVREYTQDGIRERLSLPLDAEDRSL